MRMRFREIKECKYEQAERNVVNTTYADSERPSDIPQPPICSEETLKIYNSLFADDYADSERPSDIPQPPMR